MHTLVRRVPAAGCQGVLGATAGVACHAVLQLDRVTLVMVQLLWAQVLHLYVREVLVILIFLRPRCVWTQVPKRTRLGTVFQRLHQVVLRAHPLIVQLVVHRSHF